MSKENPTSFEDIDVDELRKSAIEDFACDLKANANKKTVEAALLEDGITWEDYAKLKGYEAPAPVLEAAPEIETADAEVNVITEAPVEIVTAQPLAAVQKYLIRMDRANVRYDTRGHKFTQEHPYALVDVDDANYILEKEEGFRMATPRELQEFYG